MRTPLVTVVTPSYNMAEFLEETIQSVLMQDYPNIEYIIMDACSTDGTESIVHKYQNRLRYVSAPDQGAADAINRGFSEGSGEILAWLSADDTYLPGAITTAVRAFQADLSASAVYGHAWLADKSGTLLRPYPTQPPAALKQECCICQPASFMRRESFEAAGKLDIQLQVAFDYDLWMRLPGRLVYLDEYLATSRMYPANKTLSGRKEVYQETIRAMRRNYGYVPFQWVFGYACYLMDRRDQFYEPLRPGILKFALSLPMGFWQNRRQMGRYWAECRAVMTREGFHRRINDTWLGRVLGTGRK